MRKMPREVRNVDATTIVTSRSKASLSCRLLVFGAGDRSPEQKEALGGRRVKVLVKH